MKLSNKQIFFHLGFHKIASTFFQKKIYIDESNINFFSNLPIKVIDKWSKDNKKISKLINTILKNYRYE